MALHPRGWPRFRGRVTAAAAALALSACTPQQQLIASLLPDGTIPVFLSNFDSVSDANRRRIVEFEQQRDWDGLARFAEENVQRDPQNANWWLVAGYANSQRGDHRRAIDAYAGMVRLAPEDELGYALLAQAHRRNRQPERALQILDRALTVRRDVAPTWYLQGEIESDLGRHERAARAYREAVKLDPRYTEAWLGLGAASVRLGRKDDARQVLQVLDQLDPAAAKRLAALLGG